MRDFGWYSAQMPYFVTAPHHHEPEYVDPAIKAHQADELRAAVQAHIDAGGDYQRLPSASEQDREA